MADDMDSDPHDHAERLIEVADVIHQSNSNRQEMLGMMMDDKVFASNSTMGSEDDILTETTAESTQESDEKPRKERKSRNQTVADLKQQLQDCHKALLTMRENANLKYRKLELEYVDLKAALSTTKAELDASKVEAQNLEKEKHLLAEKLTRAVGEDNARWLSALQESSENLERELASVKKARDEAIRANEELRRMMGARDKNKRDLPPMVGRGLSTMKKDPSSRSAMWGWESFTGAIIGLNEEAKATVSPQQNTTATTNEPLSSASARAQPPPEMFMFQEQSQRIKEDLEADIEAMEKQMKDDIEALKNEWTKTPRVHSKGRGTSSSSSSSSRKSDKPKKDRSKKSKKSSAGISSLDSFFSHATAGLEDEEMDEERSFFSMSRSVSTAPADLGKQKKKKKQKHRKSSSSQDSDNVAVDRRGQFSAEGRGMSLRDNLQEKLMDLGQEQVPEHDSFFKSPRSGKTRWDDASEAKGYDAEHFDEMARQVEAWGGEASRSMTVL